MKNINKQDELLEKILIGLEKVHEKLIEVKKQKKSPIVVKEKGKIIKMNPK